MKTYAVIGACIVIIVVAALLNRKRVMTNLKKNQLSKNFNLSEFVKTSTGIENVPGETEIRNLELLCQKILQPLRDAVGKPITITSGYRSPLVNSNVKGSSKTSQHMKGQAADFMIEGMTNQEIIDLVRKLKLPYDQIIDEQLWKWSPVSGWRLAKWVHVSYNLSGTRFQWLTARNSQEKTDTIYTTIKNGLA